MTKCKHGVYDPNGDQRYCTVCNPVKFESAGFSFKKTKSSVGDLVIAIPTNVLKRRGAA
jgi:hypothetical protein